jgi:hypothetical protein
VHGRVALAPFSDVVAKEDLDREIHKDNKRQLLLLKALVQKLQARDSVVGLEPDLGDKVDDDEALNVLQLQNTPHGAVNLSNAIAVLVAVFAFHDCQSKRDYQICPPPEAQVAVELHDAGLCRSAAEPLVRKVFGVEGQEDGVGEELACGQADGLRGRGVCEVLLGQKGQRPACLRLALCKLVCKDVRVLPSTAMS